MREASDLEHALVAMREGTPVRLRDVAEIGVGPAERRGALTRSGEEAVGGVVTARHGANPRQVIENVREAIAQVEPSLPRRTLEDGTVAQVRVVPFYDRSELIDRTVGTLETALTQQVLITILVVLILLLHLRASALIATLLPAAVLLTFITMLVVGVEANVVALAGIAIAIGTMVDVGVVVTENIVQRLREAPPGVSTRETIASATAEVSGAVFTALATTVISFLPVFALTGQEGKLFGPLAWTKTFALLFSLVIALLVLPVLAHLLLGGRVRGLWPRRLLHGAIALAGAVVAAWVNELVGALIVLWALARMAEDGGWLRSFTARGGWVARGLGGGLSVRLGAVASVVLAVLVSVVLAQHWLPLGAGAGEERNVLFVLLLIGLLLGLFRLFILAYRPLLYWILRHKALFLLAPALLVFVGALAWLGYPRVLGPMPEGFHRSAAGQWLHVAFPGMNREFMPQLDEGMFLYMPSTMFHASVGSTLEMTRELDLLFETVPEVAYSVGKLGRAESPLDPAPVAMLETVIAFHPEYVQDERGRRLRFAVDADGRFERTADGNLVEDPGGRPYRLWRDHIRTSQDIWDELVAVGEIAGLTSAPKLQPISTRIVMLSSGIRAPMAVRLQGPSLETIGEAALQVEAFLREHPMVNRPAVSADRPVGTPWIEIHPDREALAAYGITMQAFQDVVEVAIGGRLLGQTVQDRERFGLRVRYPRELRDTPEAIGRILVDTARGAPVLLADLAEIRFALGPEMIRSENGQLVTFVMFDRLPEVGEVEAIEGVRDAMEAAQASGELSFANGVAWSFAGAWENNVRAAERLRLLMPLVLLLIFALLMLQFRSVALSLFIFSGVAVAFSGGFVLLWLYGQPGFLDMTVLDAHLREVFRVQPTALSVAVWVGFIALFGIATDDGVVMGTYLQQQFRGAPPTNVEDIRQRVIEAGSRRVRPCLMTTATTILALLPVLTSQGTGADVMTPMALPAVGGMAVALLTLFVVPVLFCAWEEARLAVRRILPTGPFDTGSC
ncbi:MAG: efflux RND transporter permease subunit [Deltaproteobacteria bacterium]|nr:MAG: efflux RND transporter permease subunit [Deltaproteobacteria bacterium]